MLTYAAERVRKQHEAELAAAEQSVNAQVGALQALQADVRVLQAQQADEMITVQALQEERDALRLRVCATQVCVCVCVCVCDVC